MPSALKARSPVSSRGIKFSPFKNAVSVPKSNLFSIREDSKETESVSSETSALDENPRDDNSNVSDEKSFSSCDLDGWEDETTLVARLQIELNRTLVDEGLF